MPFKILKGDSSRISTDVTPFHDGWCYFTSDDGGLYIDHDDNGAQKRTRINTNGNYVPTTRKVNGKTLDKDISLTADDVGASASGHTHTAAQTGLGNVPNVSTNNQTPTYTEADTLAVLTSGEKLSAAFGKIAKAVADLIAHIANKSNPHDVTAAQVGAVPTTRKVNNKALSADISLTASDVGARPSTWTPTAADVGAAAASHTHNNYIPTTRTVNGKALSGNISLTATDVGAATSVHTHTVSSSVSATLSSSKWQNKQQTITVSGLGATQNGIIGIPQSITDTQMDAVCGAKLRVTKQQGGSLTITADGTVPSCDIPVAITLFS